jgi:hypothetical protein
MIPLLYPNQSLLVLHSCYLVKEIVGDIEMIISSTILLEGPTKSLRGAEVSRKSSRKASLYSLRSAGHDHP